MVRTPTWTTEAAPRAAGPAAVLVLAVGPFATGTDAFGVAGLLPSMAGSIRRRSEPEHPGPDRCVRPIFDLERRTGR